MAQTTQTVYRVFNARSMKFDPLGDGSLIKKDFFTKIDLLAQPPRLTLNAAWMSYLPTGRLTDIFDFNFLPSNITVSTFAYFGS